MIALCKYQYVNINMRNNVLYTVYKDHQVTTGWGITAGVWMRHTGNQGQIHVWHGNHLCHWHILHIPECYSSLDRQYDGELMFFGNSATAAMLTQRA